MLNIIVAPKKHNSKGEKRVKKVVKYLKSSKEEFAVYFLQSLADMESTVKEITSFGEYEFVIIGDDVVVHEFINNIKDLSKVKFGIVPTSKKDDFASYLNLEHNPVQALKNIAKKEVYEVDLLLANNYKVINSIILGASVEAYEKFNDFKIKNFISEKFALTKYASKFDGLDLTLQNKSGKSKQIRAYEMIIANGGNSKGKVASPLSNVQDGLFNLIYTEMDSKRNNKKYLKLFNSGKHIYMESTQQRWLNNLKISRSDNVLKASLDGKIYNLDKLDISLIEKGLKIYK